MDFLVYLVIFLLIIMCIGHGMWVVAAWVLRGFAPREDRMSFEPTRIDDRAATARYLNDLESRGLLDRRFHAQLMELIAKEATAESLGLRYDRDTLTAAVAEGDAASPWPATAPPTAPSTAMLERERERAAHAQAAYERAARTAALEPAAPAEAGVPAPLASVANPGAPAEADRLPSLEVPPAAREPRRPWSEVLVSFMAEKNIRWGELIGGLLILCCSTALVISLWSQIEAIPVLKFVIFTSITASLFGVGLFVHHRWKLPTTGHVLLIVASLLVPLNMLAFAALSREAPVVSGWTVALEGASVLLFGWLLLLAGRILVVNGPGLFALGVVGLSALSLLGRRTGSPGEVQLLAMSLVPVSAFLAIMILVMRREARQRRLDEAATGRLFLQLGAQTFACAVPITLLISAFGQVAGAFHFFSPVLCAMAVPGLVTSVFLRRRMRFDVPAQTRTAATSVGLVAASFMLICLALAWPVPSRLLPAVLVAGSAMVAMSRLARHPAIRTFAILCFTAAWLLIVHLLLGELAWSEASARELLAVLLSARTGQALALPVMACLLIADGIGRRRSRARAQSYASTGLALAGISLLLVTWNGFAVPGDPHAATWVYLFYAVLAFVTAWRMNTSAAGAIGGILAQAAILQMAVYVWGLAPFAWPTALLIGSTGCLGVLAAMAWPGVDPRWVALYGRPLAGLTLAFSAAAALGMAAGTTADLIGALALRLGWLAVLWIVLAFLNGSPAIFAAAQAAMILTASTAIHQYVSGLPWYRELAQPWLDPWVWQVHLLVAGGFCLAFEVIRVWLVPHAGMPAQPAGSLEAPAGSQILPRLRSRIAELVDPAFPSTDRWVLGLAMLALCALACVAVLPAVAVEHGGRVAPTTAAMQGHAAGFGAWAGLMVMAATWVVYLREGRRAWSVAGLMLVAACGTALAASRCVPMNAVTMGWSWLLAAAFLGGSMLLMSARVWTPRLCRLVGPDAVGDNLRSADVRHGLLLFALPVVVLTASYAAAVSTNSALLPADLNAVWLRILLLGPCVLVGLALMAYALTERTPGYAVAAAVVGCLAVTATEMAMIARTGRGLSADLAILLLQINALLSAAVALVWHFASGLPAPSIERQTYPRWPLTFFRATFALILAVLAAIVWVNPFSVPSSAVSAGSIWGILAVVLVELAIVRACRPKERLESGSRDTLWLVFAILLGAFAMAAFDVSNWVCFHVLMVGLVLAGWGRLYMGASQVRRLLGAGWHETFHMQFERLARGETARIEHDLTCNACGYNLRSLAQGSVCPECGTQIEGSVRAAVDRLAPDYAGTLAKLRSEVIGAVLMFVGLGVLFALRAVVDDPQRPWWSALILIALAGLALVLGGWAPQRSLAYLGGLLLSVAAGTWWVVSYWHIAFAFPSARLHHLAHAVTVALAAAASAWVWIERRLVSRQGSVVRPGRWPPFQDTALAVAIAGLTVLGALTCLDAAMGKTVDGIAAGSLLAWLAALALLVTARRELIPEHVSGGLYALGLAGLLQVIGQNSPTPGHLLFAVSLGLAGYTLLSTLVHRFRTRSAKAGEPISDAGWLISANTILAGVALLLAIVVSAGDADVLRRTLVVLAPLLLAATAWSWVGTVRAAWTRTCLASLAGLALLLFTWIFVSPEMPWPWLHRAVGTIAAMVAGIIAMAALNPLLAGRESWRTVSRHVVSGAGMIGCAAMSWCCAVGVLALIDGQPMPLVAPATGVLLASLGAAVALCIAFAVNERIDPLQRDSLAREEYAYWAQAIAGVIALIVRAAMPWLFSGVITQYWPLLVIPIAVVAVAIGEVSGRRGPRVLARPFSRTGALLPLAACLELFLAASRVHFSIVLLVVGAFYAVLAAIRRSETLVLVSAAAFNGSLWFWLHQTPGLGIARHPQLWLIPPALAVLVAGHLNRRRLEAAQVRALHYACLLTIYLSSTADIFLIGVAAAPWLPLVLGGLSVAGVFVGVASRVRSFVMLGTGFLCLSLFTMIWHAAANLGWTWVWYVAGIALGLVIIVVFALFERKREQMNAWVGQFKDWSQ